MSTLEQKVEEIEQKHRDYKRNEDLDDAVDTADQQLTQYNDILKQIDGQVKRLRHHTDVLTELFEHGEVSGVDTVRKELLQITQEDSNEIINSLDRNSLNSQHRTARSIKKTVDDAIDKSRDELKQISNKWQERTSTAESISQITGDDGVNTSLIKSIEKFVQYKSTRTSTSVGELDNEWKGLIARWKKTQVDWESFQRQHNLSDETIIILQNLADDEPVSLDSTRPEIVSELFEVTALRENLKLSI